MIRPTASLSKACEPGTVVDRAFRLDRRAGKRLSHQADGLVFEQPVERDELDVEQAAPIGSDPVGMVEGHRAAVVPVRERVLHELAEGLTPAPIGLAQHFVVRRLRHEGDEGIAAGLEDAADLHHPMMPVDMDMSEDRDGVDEIERVRFQRDRRDLADLEEAERRRQVLDVPARAGPVEFASPELAQRRIAGEIAQDPADAAAEIEHALALEVETGRQAALDGATGPAPDLLELIEVRRPDPLRQTERRQRQFG